MTLIVMFCTFFCLNTARAETAAYTYDALGRLKTVVWSTGRTVTYTYDANGNRTVKVIS
jgi:YD repeat-containing protein